MSTSVGSKGSAKVKAVLSGDTVVLYGAQTPTGPADIELQLAFAVAPRLGRRGSPDEPWAWEAREFLRKELVGKTVRYEIEYQIPKVTRPFASLYTSPDDEQSVNERLVRAGLAVVKCPREHEKRADYEDAQRAAEAAKAGQFNTADGAATVRSVISVSDKADENRKLLQQLKNKRVPAIVESVRDGNSLRVLLLPSFDKNYYELMVSLTGVSCPRIKRVTVAGEKEPRFEAEPFAHEARFFTESQMLHRDCEVRLELLDKDSKHFFGSVFVSGKGSLSVPLLRFGLAQTVDWSMVGVEKPEELRAAERHAKTQRERIWAKYVAPAPLSGSQEFSGTIVEVLSADTVIVAVDENDERRVHFSSTRAPRFVHTKGEATEKPEKGPKAADDALFNSYYHASRELLRNKAIGKKVRVTIDYVRAPPADQPKAESRSFGTVMLESCNLAEFVIKNGMATVQRHAAHDENRSSQYDVLMQAEVEAKAKTLGVHRAGEHKPPTINDMTAIGAAQVAKAKQMLPFLQQLQRTRAIIERVVHGSRYVVYVPKASVMIQFGLTGIRTPRATTRDQRGEPFGDAARQFVRHQINNHAVEIEIEDVDRVGAFVGRIYTGKKTNFALQLVSEGFADVTLQSKVGGDVVAALEQAKARKLRMWENYVERAPEPLEKPREESLRREVVKVTVSDIVDATSFHVRVENANSAMLETSVHLAIINLDASASAPVAPKVGTLCAGLFDDDNRWYRCRIVEVVNGSSVRVLFVDYGNDAVLSTSALRQLPTDLASVAPAAHKAKLSFMIVPAMDEDFGPYAAGFFRDLVWGKTLTANIDEKHDDVWSVTLLDESTQGTVNEALLREGLARVEARREAYLRPMITKLKEHEQIGRRSHNYIWQYGAALDEVDDVPEFGVRAAVPAAAATTGRRR